MRHGPYLLLNKHALPIRLVALAVCSDSISSKGGKTLPPEIWFEILDIARASLHSPGCEEAFVFVRPVEVIDGRRGIKALRCVELDDDKISEGFLDLIQRSSDIGFIDHCLSRDLRGDVRGVEDYEEKLNEFGLGMEESGKVYNIMLEVPFAQHYKLPECLFDGVGTPEVISFWFNGKCQLCAGCKRWFNRKVCPGCNWTAQEKFGIMSYGCAVYNIACPVCVGMEYMEADLKFVQNWLE